jgi:hypothetical protein
VYNHLETTGGKTTYIESGVHTDTKRSLLNLYRSAPKRNGESLGIRKSGIKLTRDCLVDNASGTGSNNAPCIVDISMALPVGMAETERAAIIKTVVDLLTEGTSANLEIEPLMVVGEI